MKFYIKIENFVFWLHNVKNIPNATNKKLFPYKITPHFANIWPTANNRKRGIAHDRSGVDRHSCLHILCKPQYLHYEICFKK